MTNSLAMTFPLIRRVNLSKVLGVISAADGAVTGSDLIAATGLTRATVHAVSNDLIRMGWVREQESRREAGNQVGRASRWFEFNERAGYVLGVDIGAHSSTLLLADLRGRTLAIERVATDERTSYPEQGVTVQRAARQAAHRAGVQLDDILAVAMGFAARVDRDGRIASEDPGSQASYTARRDALTEITGAAVLVENDANLAALGEHWRGAARGAHDLAVLLAGERLGVGFLESGRLLHGSQGGAGEMAFLDMVDGVGNADGIAYLARQWGAEAVGKKPRTMISELAAGSSGGVSAEMVFAAAATGDRVAARILDRLATRIARVVAVLGTLFNPELVVIAGAVSQSAAVLLDAITAALPTLTTTPPRVAVSSLGDAVVSEGAVRLALNYVQENALDLKLTG